MFELILRINQSMISESREPVTTSQLYNGCEVETSNGGDDIHWLQEGLWFNPPQETYEYSSSIWNTSTHCSVNHWYIRLHLRQGPLSWWWDGHLLNYRWLWCEYVPLYCHPRLRATSCYRLERGTIRFTNSPKKNRKNCYDDTDGLLLRRWHCKPTCVRFCQERPDTAVLCRREMWEGGLPLKYKKTGVITFNIDEKDKISTKMAPYMQSRGSLTTLNRKGHQSKECTSPITIHPWSLALLALCYFRWPLKSDLQIIVGIHLVIWFGSMDANIL